MNIINEQDIIDVDTAFMYVLSVIMMVKIYQSRHPDVNARAHATFGVLAVMIALGKIRLCIQELLILLQQD